MSIYGLILMAVISFEKISRIVYSILVVVLVYLFFTSLPARLDFKFKSFVREYKKSFVHSEITPYGELYLHKKDNETICSINHTKIFSFPDTRNIQEIVHSSLLQYPWAASVLVIGEWSEIVNEILRYPNIKNVYWASPVPQVFKILSDLSGDKIDYSGKLRMMKNSDPRNFIRKIRKEAIFDIVLISLPDPTNILFNRYYTHEFYQELSTILTSNSMISTTLQIGEQNIGENDRNLSSAVYRTLTMSFPNTLELAGKKTQILASYNRNFTTSYKALSEFLNALNGMPDYISPSLIKFKLSSIDNLRKELESNAFSALNKDSLPQAFSYSLNELLTGTGKLSKQAKKFLNKMNSAYIYIFIFLSTVIFLFINSSSVIEKKLVIITYTASIIFMIFLYDMTITLHSNNGRIFRYISILLAIVILGLFIAFKLFKGKDPKLYVSFLRILLLCSAIFFALLPAVLEINFSPPTIPLILVFALIGSIFMGGVKFLSIASFIQLKRSKTKLVYLYSRILCGFLIGMISIMILIPLLGLIDILPAVGIICLGCATLISI
ncbi:hypothetical protein ACFLTD_01550 [Elusimicrobiota bacterium]